MLVDSHCHLDFDSFATDRSEVIQRARSAGVQTLVTICTRVSRFGEILKIAESDSEIWCSVGIHPHHTEEEDLVSVDDLVERATHPKVIGIGETGLDYHYDNSPRELQKTSFRTHIAAARSSGLPLIVHNRQSDEDMIEILEEEMSRGAFSGVLHCFSSGQTLARRALKMGFYISLSGIVTFRNAKELRELVEEIPEEKLLVETDAPFLAPVPNRGKRNEPSFVVHTATEVARLKNMNIKAFSKCSTENFYRLFKKARR